MDNKSDFFNRKYDIVVWRNVHDYGTSMDDIYNTKTIRNLELMNINSFSSRGQVHFKDENGAYVLYPWSAIITMEPSPVVESEE